MQSSYKYII